jgi:hypothetical protein
MVNAIGILRIVNNQISVLRSAQSIALWGHAFLLVAQ